MAENIHLTSATSAEIIIPKNIVLKYVGLGHLILAKKFPDHSIIWARQTLGLAYVTPSSFNGSFGVSQFYLSSLLLPT